MKNVTTIFSHRKEPLVWFVIAGIVSGMLLVKITMGIEGIKNDFLSVDMLYEVKYMSVDSSSFFVYVFRKRIGVILGLVLLATTYFGVIVAYSYAGWIGVSIGTILASAVTHYGAKGLLLFMATLFPHYFFYMPAWIMLLQGVREICFCIYFPARRKRNYIGGRKEEIQYIVVLLVKVLVVVIIGAIAECYVNQKLLIGLLKIF